MIILICFTPKSSALGFSFIKNDGSFPQSCLGFMQNEGKYF